MEQSLPLSANGKVDRKLLSQELSYKLTADFEIPKGQLEEQIASLWCETLNCQKISRNADFFMLGGDSLVATQIVQLLQKRRISPGTVPLSMIFTSPTIATMAKQIQSQWQKLGLDSSDTTESLFEEGTI
ncbi:phosphopantetheine-binding protein [Psychromonas hadalis]|uniref:phosphopantetheine-binding protein n=1 Tax=Psychromonas hadalis TaxID=211669 RepID=UPI0024814ECE|nr:phosphopantetheine-binding protein [Psychromonas hadalis]